MCIFNPTWFKFWLSLTFSWQIPFVLDQKDNRLGAGTSSSSSMLCSLNAGGFLLFCIWESKKHRLGWIPTEFVQEGFVFISWMIGWMKWIKQVSSESALKIGRKRWRGGEKWLSFRLLHFFLLLLQTIWGCCCMSKVIMGLAVKKRMQHTSKCLSPVGGSFECSTD